MTRVLDLPIAHLATTLAPLRGPRTDPASPLAPLPVRVAASEDRTYEVLDGFKRVARWIADGHTHVPAVVEDAPGVVRKARLLEANAPRRTLSAMDEARVVRSLADDDQLTAPQMAKLLGRGPLLGLDVLGQALHGAGQGLPGVVLRLSGGLALLERGAVPLALCRRFRYRFFEKFETLPCEIGAMFLTPVTLPPGRVDLSRTRRQRRPSRHLLDVDAQAREPAGAVALDRETPPVAELHRPG